MSQSQILEVDDILARADSLTGKTFTTEALCTHICAHGGGKIFLMGSDDTKTIRVEAGTKIGSFKPETVNNLVRITGKLVEQRIDEAYLTEWEAQVKAQTAEKHGTTEHHRIMLTSAEIQEVSSSSGSVPGGLITGCPGPIILLILS